MTWVILNCVLPEIAEEVHVKHFATAEFLFCRNFLYFACAYIYCYETRTKGISLAGLHEIIKIDVSIKRMQGIFIIFWCTHLNYQFQEFFYWWIIFFMLRSLNLWDCWIDAKIIIGIFNVKKDIWMMCALHLNPFGLDLKNKSREMPWTKAIKVPNYGNVKTCIPFL